LDAEAYKRIIADMLCLPHFVVWPPNPLLRGYFLNAGAKVPQDRNREYDRRRQTHNLKVIGSNPIPATSHQALENKSFSRVFAVRVKT
jgi:hypothetical protein